jgi:hypothetical protein
LPAVPGLRRLANYPECPGSAGAPPVAQFLRMSVARQNPAVICFTRSNLFAALINKARVAREAGMPGEQESFQVGERVRLSELGRERMPRSKSHTAKVVGYGRSDTRIRVVFDGAAYPVSIHVSYLERDE